MSAHFLLAARQATEAYRWSQFLSACAAYVASRTTTRS